jgi:hypothetical protein
VTTANATSIDAGTSGMPGARETDPRDAASAPPAEAPHPRLAFVPPPWFDRALEAAIIAAKGVTVACAVDGFLNADSARFRGKWIRPRAIGYTAGLFVVPAIWRVLPNRGRYPRGLDLAVALPLLIDAVGNALGLYEEAHLDDIVHFLNAAIVAAVAGAVYATRTDDPWLAALAGTGTSISGESTWEILEYVSMKAGQTGQDLTYRDTIVDMLDSTLGAVVGGIITWLRMPREKEARSRGWRHAVGGWRDDQEPVSLVGPRGSVAHKAVHRVLRAADG